MRKDNSYYCDDHSNLAFEAIYKAIKGEGIKILRPKEMHQRLAIVLALVKAENTPRKLTKWNPSNHVLFVSNKRFY